MCRLHISRQSLDPLPSTLGVLASATALEDLDISGCFCDCPTSFNQALTALRPLSRLSRLSLDTTPVDGNGLRAFCSHATVGPPLSWQRRRHRFDSCGSCCDVDGCYFLYFFPLYLSLHLFPFCLGGGGKEELLRATHYWASRKWVLLIARSGGFAFVAGRTLLVISGQMS